jgi:predicted O-methyltransferase YrrM
VVDLGTIEPLPDRLAPELSALRELQRELEPAYDRYVTEVSDPAWAASIQLAAFLWHVSRVSEPTSILELGSGFTSYVFRRYAEEHGGVTVLSADNSEDWLRKTADFLRNVGSRDDGLILLEDLEEVAVERDYGLVFNDVLGTLRVDLMAAAMRFRSPEGIVVVDDAHREPDRWSAMNCARREGLEVYDLRPWTLDLYGRWAVLVAG